MCKLTHKIDTNKKIIYQFFEGELMLQDLIKMREDVYSDPLYNENFDVIHDLRKSWLLLTEDDLDKFTEFMHKSGKESLHKRKSILIINEPLKFYNVMSIYQSSLNKKQLPITVFALSSIEEAEYFLIESKNIFKK